MPEDEKLPELTDAQLDTVNGGRFEHNPRCPKVDNDGAQDLADARELFGARISNHSKVRGPSSSGA